MPPLPSFLSDLFRKLVPEPHLRTPLTLSNAYVLTLPFFPILFLAYLVRRPNTHLLRIMVAPIVVLVTIRTYFSHYWIDPTLNVYNWGAGLLALAIIARALEYAFIPKGRLKVGEEYPGKLITPAIDSSLKQNGNGVSQREQVDDGTKSFALYQGFKDAMEVLCSMRGIGWDFGVGVYVPKVTQTLPHLCRTFIISFLALDFMESVAKLYTPWSTPHGGSMFYPGLKPVEMYALSTALHFLTGCAVIAGFEFIYSLLAIIGVTILGHKPSIWPPLMDKPWLAQSLHEFWAKRWHQVLRQTFLVFGGYPLAYLIGFNRTLQGIGLIMGTFIASGLFHNLSIYAMGKGTSPETMVFFAGQGIAMILERVWHKVTGRRVGGIWGMLWVYLVIVAGGQLCIDSWHRKGLAGGLVIPPIASPTRQLLWPFLFKLLPAKQQ